MQNLIVQAKKNKSKRGVMSLKSFVKSPQQDIANPNNINELMLSIHILEILGPPNSAVIPLLPEEIEHLKQNGSRELYWPKGNNGITWISNPHQNYN